MLTQSKSDSITKTPWANEVANDVGLNVRIESYVSEVFLVLNDVKQSKTKTKKLWTNMGG